MLAVWQERWAVQPSGEDRWAAPSPDPAHLLPPTQPTLPCSACCRRATSRSSARASAASCSPAWLHCRLLSCASRAATCVLSARRFHFSISASRLRAAAVRLATRAASRRTAACVASASRCCCAADRACSCSSECSAVKSAAGSGCWSHALPASAPSGSSPGKPRCTSRLCRAAHGSCCAGCC